MLSKNYLILNVFPCIIDIPKRRFLKDEYINILQFHSALLNKIHSKFDSKISQKLLNLVMWVNGAVLFMKEPMRQDPVYCHLPDARRLELEYNQNLYFSEVIN